MTRTTLRITLLSMLMSLNLIPNAKAQSMLEDALNVMYTACLFGEGSPFSQAIDLSQQSLAPGISNFIESSLASIPLTPPVLKAQFKDGEIVTTVTGFTPIYTESSSTVGKGQFMMGSNFSYFDLTKLRGTNLSELSFSFEQDGGGDVISVDMPMDINASVFTLFGTYGISDRLDIGFALPFVNLTMARQPATFRVFGSKAGCRWGAGCTPGQEEGAESISYAFTDGVAIDLNADGDIEAPEVDNPSVPGSNFNLSTIALRAKYRIPVQSNNARLAAVFDVRIPMAGNNEQMVGNGFLGWRFTLIGEYFELETFRPYVNIGVQAWNGVNSNNLNLAFGFSQKVASKLFFAFDLLGKVDLASDVFLAPIDNLVPMASPLNEFTLLNSTIPFADRDHTLNAGMGFQVLISPSFQFYGSALFSLLDRGLQADIVPSFGAAVHF